VLNAPEMKILGSMLTRILQAKKAMAVILPQEKKSRKSRLPSIDIFYIRWVGY